MAGLIDEARRRVSIELSKTDQDVDDLQLRIAVGVITDLCASVAQQFAANEVRKLEAIKADQLSTRDAEVSGAARVKAAQDMAKAFRAAVSLRS